MDSGNSLEPGADIEKLYDDFLNRISTAYPKVNNNLLVKIMALERKFSDSLPHVHLEVAFKEGIDIERPKYDISEKHHVQDEQNQILVSLNSGIFYYHNHICFCIRGREARPSFYPIRAIEYGGYGSGDRVHDGGEETV